MEDKTPPDGTILGRVAIMELSTEAIKLATVATELRGLAAKLAASARDLDNMSAHERARFVMNTADLLVEAADLCHSTRRVITGRPK